MKKDNNSFDENRPSWLNENEPITPNSKKPGSSVPNSPANSVESKRLIEKKKEPEEEEDNFVKDCCCCLLDPVLCGFMIFHNVVALLTATSIIANIFVFSKLHMGEVDVRDIFMRCYAILFSCIAIVSELDMRVARKYVKILEFWVVRGFWYAFIGFISAEQEASIISFQNIIGIAMVFLGFIYFIMGLLCLRDMKRRRMTEQYGPPYLSIQEPEGTPYSSV